MKKYYKKKEFAEAVGIERHTLNRWIKNRKLLPLVDERGKEYFSEEQVESLRETHYGKLIWYDDNWIDLRAIEREIGRGRYKWKEACEQRKSAPFFFNGKEGTLSFIRCMNNTLTIEIDGKEESISTAMLLRVQLARITGAISYNYKYAVGERIQLGKTDITILEQYRSGKKNVRVYRYHCNKCNQENRISEYSINDKGCCPVCAGNIVISSINDIATTDAWMLPYFDNPELAKQYSRGSKSTPAFHCPDCGRKRKKPLMICTLYRTRSIGCVCGDGYSYPNKFMYSLLDQLLRQKKISWFDSEFIDDWTEGRKYDFIVELVLEGKKIIIEMDGGLGHGNRYLDDTVSPAEAKEIDAWKDSQAKKHGIHVYRIDATQSSVNFLKESIIKEVSSVIDLSEVSWEEADKFAISNLTKRVCQYYENNKPLSTEQLSKIFHIHKTTALSYIRRGEQYGWCSYDWALYYDSKYAFAKKEHEDRKQKLIEVCEYYETNKPVLATEMARHFGVNISTIMKYLKDGEEMGYEPYDKVYAKEKSKEQLKKVSKEHLKRPVLCFTKENVLIKRYSSLKEAADHFGVSSSAISRCCRKKGSCVGLKFRYEE